MTQGSADRYLQIKILKKQKKKKKIMTELLFME